ncbi:DUF1145 domain-containing protein [Kistimonas scapharcae]|uniref:DUF1145 domain-containing protein n=1 Tax=Kistimonas scapharcae TaxID=1036133 RepID=A0ABP8V1Y3_9GAMM
MKAMLALGQLLTLGFWLGVILNFFMPFPAPLDSIFLIAGGLILLVHGIEVAIWRERIRAMSDRFVMDCLLILVFGFFHMATLMLRQQPVQEH